MVLNMQARWNVTVSDGRRLSENIRNTKAKIDKGLDTVDQSLLKEAMEEAKAFGYETGQVVQLRDYADTLAMIQEGLNEFSQSKLEVSLKKAMTLHMNENELLEEARRVVQTINEARAKAAKANQTVETAFETSGSVTVQHEQLKAAVDLADSVGGLRNNPDLDKSRTLLTRIQTESKMVDKLKFAVNSGGWFNHGVKHVDRRPMPSPRQKRPSTKLAALIAISRP
jgi:hypothetical protein